MGIPAFNVAASVSLITAQRLIRRLCDHCKCAVDETQTELFFKTFNSQDNQALTANSRTQAKLFKAVGCSLCDKGYKGRIGIYQVMPISHAMQALILSDSDSQTLAAQAAAEGIRTLRQAGWLKVLQGITSMDEVMALTIHD